MNLCIIETDNKDFINILKSDPNITSIKHSNIYAWYDIESNNQNFNICAYLILKYNLIKKIYGKTNPFVIEITTHIDDICPDDRETILAIKNESIVKSIERDRSIYNYKITLRTNDPIASIQYLEENYPIKEINKLTYTVLVLINNSLYENQLPYIIIQSDDASIIDSLKDKEYIVIITGYKYNYYKLETTHNNPTEFAKFLKHKYGFIECYYEKPVEIHHCVF
jgi:hypothetical protein